MSTSAAKTKKPTTFLSLISSYGHARQTLGWFQGLPPAGREEVVAKFEKQVKDLWEAIESELENGDGSD